MKPRTTFYRERAGAAGVAVARAGVAAVVASGVGVTGVCATGVTVAGVGITEAGVVEVGVTGVGVTELALPGPAMPEWMPECVTGVGVTGVTVAGAGLAGVGVAGFFFGVGLGLGATPLTGVRGPLSFIRSTPFALTVPFNVPKLARLINGCDALVKDTGKFGPKLP